MKNSDYVINLLAPYEPQLPIEQLVMEINKLFHAAEASDYDRRHPEVYNQLPPLWQEMIQQALERSQSKVWRIFDFGCGTGFEAEQLIHNLRPGAIAQLTCYDPSPDMLERCRAKISPLFPNALFISDLKDCPANIASYNLLTTNSLLHHLPDPLLTISNLLPLLTSDVIWIAGHEPSSRFYKSPECMKMYNQFLQERKWSKFLSLEKYFEKLKQIVGLESEPAEQAAKQAFHQGLFKKQPPALVIDRLVDFHVAHSLEEATTGRGFDFEILQQDWMKSWELVWVKTYSFMGAFYEQDLNEKWASYCQDISCKFPKDGANFCTIWRRVG